MNITVVHLMDLVSYPPVLSLLDNLLANNHSVQLISYGIDKAPQRIKCHQNIHTYEIPISSRKDILGKIIRERSRRKNASTLVNQVMESSDILWTTTDISVRCLGDTVLKYKHVMQLMELEEWYPYIVGLNHPKFPLKKYAQHAWKTIVPEINRAYIQKTWWELKKTPYVLPNKPYSLVFSTDGMEETIDRLKKDKRKKIVYLGNISSDRNLDEFAKAVSIMGVDYCLVVVGRVDETEKERFLILQRTYANIEYLGYIKAPNHLSVLQHAHIGLLPYYPNSRHQFISPLNIQYCAPNKIFEYAAFGVPMIGTDVMGLKQPFEKYNIGKCCTEMDANGIVAAIKEIENNYEIMSNNCKQYYNSIDLDKLVNTILYE